jgi:radical SAM superfamily enzyme YgiQ (UPF0313 family)
MKLGLIFPQGNLYSRNRRFADSFRGSPGAMGYYTYWSGVGGGLLILAALTPPRFEVAFVDESLRPLTFDEDFDLVAISCLTQQATRAYLVADEFRRRGKTVVLGGIHPTVLPDDAKRHADSVVIGEAENVWPRLLSDFERGRLEPFYQSRDLLDLKDSPRPRYDLLRGLNYPVAWVQASRGCPRDCEFCAASKVFGPKYRHKSVEQVVGEIRFVKQELGIDHINFGDDNLFVDKRFYLPLIEALPACGIRWRAQTDVSIADNPDLLKKLYDSGCLTLFLGLESVDPEGLRDIDKANWKLKQRPRYAEAIERIQSHGLSVQGAFIVGLDSDDPSIFDRLIEFIEANHLFSVQVAILTPVPGTRLRERLEREGRVLDTPWENYTGFDVNYVPRNMTGAQLEEGLLRVYQHVTSADFMQRYVSYFRRIHSRLVRKAPVPAG